jgi:subtilisin family serine protease
MMPSLFRQKPRAVAQLKKRLEYFPGRILLKVREQPLRRQLADGSWPLTAGAAARLPETIMGPLNSLRNNAGLKAVRPLFSTHGRKTHRSASSLADRHTLAILSSVAECSDSGMGGFTVLSVDPKSVTTEVMKNLLDSPMVEIAEPMPARWLMGCAADPMQNLQWGLRAIGWFEADRPDASEISVAVLDTGIDVRHPDFADVKIDYHHDSLSPQDILGHGTHVAGVIAAETNNGVGIAGVANCKLDVWKIFPDQPVRGDFYVDGERYLQALNAVRPSGIKVMNLSIGGTASSRTETLLFRRLEADGVLSVAAMGNEFLDGNPKEYPAAYKGVLAVGAVNEKRERSWFSNTGHHIDLVAPGSNILSTVPTMASPHLNETHYAAWSGTSMATPHVTAAAALVSAQCGEANARDVRDQLAGTATRLAAMKNKSKTNAYGAGLLNLKQALLERKMESPECC